MAPHNGKQTPVYCRVRTMTKNRKAEGRVERYSTVRGLGVRSCIPTAIPLPPSCRAGEKAVSSEKAVSYWHFAILQKTTRLAGQQRNNAIRSSEAATVAPKANWLAATGSSIRKLPKQCRSSRAVGWEGSTA